MARHSRIAGFLRILARQMIVGGTLWTWFSWVQLVMLPDEWMRTVWYLAGAGLVAAGVFIIRCDHRGQTRPSQEPTHLQHISSLIAGG